MNASEMVQRKRKTARKTTIVLLWIVFLSTVLLFFGNLEYASRIIPTALFNYGLLIVNPFMFLYHTLSYYSVPMIPVTVALAVIAAIPLIGCWLMDKGKILGRSLVFYPELLSIVMTVLLGFYIIYSLDGTEIVYLVPGYLLMLVSGILIPSLILLFLNRWSPKIEKT